MCRNNLRALDGVLAALSLAFAAGPVRGAGKGANFSLTSALKIAGAAVTSMTEDRIARAALDLSHVEIGAHETLTLELTIPRTENDWQPEEAQ